MQGDVGGNDGGRQVGTAIVAVEELMQLLFDPLERSFLVEDLLASELVGRESLVGEILASIDSDGTDPLLKGYPVW